MSSDAENRSDDDVFVVGHGPGFRIIDVRSDIDIASAPQFRSVIGAGDGTNEHVIVDLSQCRYLDSSGVTILASQQRRRRNVSVVLPEGHGLHHIFRITGLDRYLPFFETRADAILIASAHGFGEPKPQPGSE